jgi:hypothetical protein
MEVARCKGQSVSESGNECNLMRMKPSRNLPIGQNIQRLRKGGCFHRLFDGKNLPATTCIAHCTDWVVIDNTPLSRPKAPGAFFAI